MTTYSATIDPRAPYSVNLSNDQNRLCGHQHPTINAAAACAGLFRHAGYSYIFIVDKDGINIHEKAKAVSNKTTYSAVAFAQPMRGTSVDQLCAHKHTNLKTAFRCETEEDSRFRRGGALDNSTGMFMDMHQFGCYNGEVGWLTREEK